MVMCFRISLRQQFEKNATVSYLLECLQHDNAQLNTAHHTVKQIYDLKMDVFTHLPHSPAVLPSDFHLFWPLKDDLRGPNFRSEKEVIRQCMSGRLSNRKTSPEEFMSQ